MRRYRLSRTASRELNEILIYIAGDSPRGARRIRDLVFQACDRLARHPGMGHKREDITDKKVRFWNVRGRFVLVYRDAARPIEIVRIFRAGRDIEAALR